MSFLDNLLGKAGLGSGTDALGGLQELIQQQGGVQGLSQKLGASGLGDVAKSWIEKGQNLPISAEQIEGVIGSGQVGQFAQKLGVSPSQAAGMLAAALPMIVDRLTPNADAAEADGEQGSVLDNLPGGLGGLLGGLLKR